MVEADRPPGQVQYPMHPIHTQRQDPTPGPFSPLAQAVTRQQRNAAAAAGCRQVAPGGSARGRVALATLLLGASAPRGEPGEGAAAAAAAARQLRQRRGGHGAGAGATRGRGECRAAGSKGRGRHAVGGQREAPRRAGATRRTAAAGGRRGARPRGRHAAQRRRGAAAGTLAGSQGRRIIII